MKTLATIQARGGSKGIPGKNIKLLAGKPLIAWTIEAALNSKLVERVVVSTDDETIAQISRQYGAEVPFLRPKEFASDDAKSVGLLNHALTWLKDNESYEPDILVQLKPTNPLRTSAHIDACIYSYLASPEIDSLITLTKSPAHPLKTFRFNGDLIIPFIPADELFGLNEAAKMPRQKLPEAFVQNSCVNVINPKTIFLKNSSLGKVVKGFVMNRIDSINIDDELDFMLAGVIIKKRSEESCGKN